MSNKVTGPTRRQQWLRAVLVLGYLLAVGLGFVTDLQPRLFWTVILPLVPISIVLMGFPMWRRICPLAFFGEIGRKLNRGVQRRVPQWLEKWFFVVTIAVLAAMLVFRLLATNGDGHWLSGLLIGLALAAAVTNWWFTGKTWCNFICPVGPVERIYTEPGSLMQPSANSQCVRCTACKKYCPDIDQENGYWRDLSSTGRRVAGFAFPGMVLAFYAYYWLRHGSWEAYFDGRWTQAAADSDLVLGAGFFFAPQVPALLAAPLTLLALAATSYGLFCLIERFAARIVEDDEQRRHVVLALASFAAFSIFYLFAGAPTLRRLPGGIRSLAFAAPILATLFLVKRWRRRREHYIGEKGAARLLRNWPFDDPPPDDPREVYAWVKAGEHARDQHLEAYANTVREMIGDGLVGSGELRLLDEVRKQLGISTREHERVLARLSEEERDLFAQDGTATVEQRAQLEGYKTALTEALLNKGGEREILELRRAFGIEPRAHAALLASLRSDSGSLLEKTRLHLHRALDFQDRIAVLGEDRPDARGFLAYLLSKTREGAVERALDLLEITFDAERVQALRPGLLAEDTQTREEAVSQLCDLCADHEDLAKELQAVLLEQPTADSEPRANDLAAVLESSSSSSDPYLRAASVWAAVNEMGTEAGKLVAGAIKDPNPLVRETAVHSARHILKVAEDQMMGGEDRAPAPVSEAASAALEEGTDDPTLAALWGAIGADAEAKFESFATVEKMIFLRGVPLFEHLDPEDLHDLSLLTEDRSVEPSQTLCEEGKVDSQDLFILVEGRAVVSVRARDGSKETERELGLLEPGEVIGELSLLDGSPRSATVRPSGGPVKVLRIPGQLFRSRLLHRPRVATALLNTMAQTIRRLSLKAAGGGAAEQAPVEGKVDGREPTQA